jgi:hypothetical protein
MRPSRRAVAPFACLVLVGAAVLAIAALGCGARADGYDAPGAPDTGADTTTLDATGDAGTPDVTDASDAEVVAWNDPNDPTKWSAFVSDAGGAQLAGGTFDGRYVYFAGSNATGSSPIVTRFDTQGAFDDPSSWSTFDAAVISGEDAGVNHFVGATFDGRYAYFAPTSYFGTSVTARYDTRAPFADVGSWSGFDTRTLAPLGSAFAGATYDGHFVYFIPTGIGQSGAVLARYDPTGDFAQQASWASFDVETVDALDAGTSFFGGVFDGRFLFVMPQYGAAGSVARYDTAAALVDAGSWAVFDPYAKPPASLNGAGGAFDGRYVYVAALPVARFDVRLGFTDPAAWSTFDPTQAGLLGAPGDLAIGIAGFDGRRLYFLAGESQIVVYDTRSTFGDPGSWSVQAHYVESYQAFVSAIFDGRYMYFASASGAFVRFDARTPPAMPDLPAFHGSFF